MTGNEIRQFVKDRMKEQRRTLLHTAPEMFVSRHTLAWWLSGRSDFPVDGLAILLDLLGYEIEIRRKGGGET